MAQVPRIWYPAFEEPGGITLIKPTSIAHLLYKGIFLCGRKIKEVIKETGCDKGVTRGRVLEGYGMCKGCEEAYKHNPIFPYWKWVHFTTGYKEHEEHTDFVTEK